MEPQTPAQTVVTAANEAAKIVGIAAEEAKKVVEKATDAAVSVVDKEHHHEAKLGKMLSDSLREVFGEYEEAQRFVDVKRIPLICKSILDIHDSQKRMEESMEKKDGDHEVRIKALEISTAKLMAYGTALIFALGIAEFIIGKVWK